VTNVLVTCSIIAKTALPVLQNMLSFSKNVNRDWQEEFTSNMSRGYAPGQTINIKRPPRYTYRAGSVAVPQATVETTVPLTLSQGGVDLNFTSLEKTLSLTRLEDKIAAAIAPVCNEIDRQGCSLARFSTYNALNPTGALPTTQIAAVQVITDANRRLDEMGAPRDMRRNMIMGPGLNGAMLNGFSGMFVGAGLAKQYQSGMMQNAFGIDPAMDQNIDTHTNGTQAVAGVNVSGANQTGSSITTVALTGTITRGTVITLPGVFAVNPQSRQSTGVLAQFVVTSDLAVGATSIPLSPALVTSGAFQNVSASPTTGSPFLIVGAASTAYQCNVAYHRDAFTLAMAPLWAPMGGKGVIDVAQESVDGFTLKVTKFYDGINDKEITRIDTLFGWAATYPELSTKIYSV
jgi:hypothetical protein